MQSIKRNFTTKLALAAAAASTLLLAGGCARVHTHQGYVLDQPLIDAVQPGIDNKQSVEGTLGRPTFAGQFSDNDWYYVARESRQLAFSSPRPVSQTILHVKFDASGNVLSVDRKGMEQVVNLSPNGDKTPTLGRRRTLFQEIFGNIGAVGAGGVGGGSTGPTGPGPNGS